MNKKLAIVLSILVLSLIATAFQYVEVLKSEIVKAYSANKPTNGHSWTEMECTSDLCITNSKVGIGTDNPSQKLEVSGSIKADSLCLGSTGACISDISAFLGTLPIAGGNDHNQGACTSTHSIDGSTHGVLINQEGLSYPICQFAGISCPTGWSPYNNWSTTLANGCGGNCGVPCSVPGHTWSNTVPEVCWWHTRQAPPSQACDAHPCPATITQIGCY